MIHSILILKRTGEKLYHCNYSDIAWNEILTSGFISALFSFSQELFEADIQDIELGSYRLLFESESKHDLIYLAIFDKLDSIINIRQKLDELTNKIEAKYEKILQKDLITSNDLEGIGELTDEIIKPSISNEYLTNGLKKDLIDILKEFKNNSEILDADLISGMGIPLSKEWKKDFLALCLRQMDAFWKSKQYLLDQIILSYEGRHLILYKINKNLVLSCLIRRNTPLGMATLLLEESVDKINKILPEY
ncbi:MAG: hypothetical protein EU541_01850 [Promethearchaeota archaeon]|nr:MAG: hypothetical protein EU541_01850 [Candidatus Lokiarchaeota archaeon]